MNWYANLLKSANVIAHNPDGRYYYRVHPKGDIQNVLRGGLDSCAPNDGPGGYVDDHNNEARWPDQDELDPYTNRMYVADKQWNDLNMTERFRIRIPAFLIEDRVESCGSFKGDSYVDTGADSENILQPSQFDIDYGGGNWVRADMAQNLMSRSWRHLWHKPQGYFGNRMHEDPEEFEQEDEDGNG